MRFLTRKLPAPTGGVPVGGSRIFRQESATVTGSATDLSAEYSSSQPIWVGTDALPCQAIEAVSTGFIDNQGWVGCFWVGRGVWGGGGGGGGVGAWWGGWGGWVGAWWGGGGSGRGWGGGSGRGGGVGAWWDGRGVGGGGADSGYSFTGTAPSKTSWEAISADGLWKPSRGLHTRDCNHVTAHDVSCQLRFGGRRESSRILIYETWLVWLMGCQLRVLWWLHNESLIQDIFSHLLSLHDLYAATAMGCLMKITWLLAGIFMLGTE